MIRRHIRKVATEDGRQVEYVAELLLTRDELCRLLVDPDATAPLNHTNRIKVAALLDEIDTARRDFTPQGMLTEEGRKRYANLRAINRPAIGPLPEVRPPGRGEECAL